MKLNLYCAFFILISLLLGVTVADVSPPGVAVKLTPLLTLSMFYPLGSTIVTVNDDVGRVTSGVLTIPMFTYMFTSGSKYAALNCVIVIVYLSLESM